MRNRNSGNKNLKEDRNAKNLETLEVEVQEQKILEKTEIIKKIGIKARAIIVIIPKAPNLQVKQ